MLNYYQVRFWSLSIVIGFILFGLGVFIFGKLNNKDIQVTYSSIPTQIVTATPRNSTHSTGSGQASMIFVGDIMLSRSVGDTMAVKNDYLWPFRNIAEYLNSADITFANLETPISSRGKNVGSIYSFRSDPKSIEGLTYAGFDVLSVANNHAWDWGHDAFVDTLYHLASAGIEYVGGGHNEYETHAGVIKKVGDTKVGFLAYTNLLPKSLSAVDGRAGVAVLDELQMIEDIKIMKNRAELVVVSFHWGEEYKPIHNSLQEQIAHQAIDAGADLIIGHHPHVVQDIQQYKGKYIVYSLGNFVFDQNWSTETMKGLSVRVWLKNNMIDRIEQIPIHISKQYQASL